MIRKPKLMKTSPPIAITHMPGPGPVNASELVLVLFGAVAAVVAAELVGLPEVVPPVLVPAEGGLGGVGVPFPFVIVAVSRVSAALLVHGSGTFVEPIAIDNVRGLLLENCGCVTVMDDCWPDVIVPDCVPATATAAFVGKLAGTVKLPERLSEGVPTPPVTDKGKIPENVTVAPGVVNGSRAAGN
jgi:hypothetical protein